MLRAECFVNSGFRMRVSGFWCRVSGLGCEGLDLVVFVRAEDEGVERARPASRPISSLLFLLDTKVYEP